jgi:Protein of unknown function (DUF3613)
MTPIKHRPLCTDSPTQRGWSMSALLVMLTTATSAMAQEAPTDARRPPAPTSVTTPGETTASPAAPITARTWLDLQASGSLASPSKQTLNGPAMSRIYQRFLLQLSGKDKAAGDASTETDANGKGGASDDLVKGLSASKP